jgi:ATP-dependent RNA helicase DDX5/DBP2
MIAKPVSLKKAKKAAKQRAAAEANAARAEAFMAAKDGRAEAPNKRKAENDDEELAHDALEAAVQSGAAAAERKAAKKAKKAKKERRAPEDDDDVVDGDAKKPKKPKKPKTAGENKDDDDNALEEERDGVPSSDETSDAADADAIAKFVEEHQIKVPADAPKPFITFQAAPFPKRLTAALLKQGYKTPSPIQAQAWPIALTGKDIVAVAKTGSGKTCGFLLPALCRIVKNGACAAPEMEMVDGRFRPAAVTPSAIVLAPTRELAIQIGDECLKFCPAANAKVVTLYGGASKGDQLRALRAGADIVVATPGRLNDFLAPPPGFSAPVRATHAKYVVLDEADRMLDMGFEPQIKKILKLCPSARQTLMFTATWPEAVRKIAEQFTVDPTHVRIGDGGTRLTANTSITQTVEIIDEDSKLDRAIAVLKKNITDGARGIVFCGTKRRCDFLDRKIKACGLRSAGAVHGDKDQAEREYSLDLFRKGKAPLLVATDVAARGLDIPGVAFVLVYDFPLQTEDYVHRIGRTGRAGAVGASHCFFTEDNRHAARELVQILEGAKQEVPDALRDMAEAQGRRKGGGRGGGRGRGGFGRGGGRGGRGGGGRGGRGGARQKW